MDLVLQHNLMHAYLMENGPLSTESPDPDCIISAAWKSHSTWDQVFHWKHPDGQSSYNLLQQKQQKALWHLKNSTSYACLLRSEPH